MKKLLSIILGFILFLGIGVPAEWVDQAYAEEVKFTGTTAQIGVNVRSGPSTSSPVMFVIRGNTVVEFDGWETGETLKDYWTGQNDNRWFYYNDNGRKYYLASAFVNGNPPANGSETPSQQPAKGASVPDVKQKMSNWCWAGTSVAILEHYGKRVSQEEFVRVVKGGLYNNPATAYEFQRGLRNYGVNSQVYNQRLSLQTVKSELDKGRPMVAFIRWNNGAAIGHFLVMDGYYYGANGTTYVNYMDPWYGDHFTHSFNSFQQNSSFTWTGTTTTWR
ncbi:papain-like cysteine protease family protein [Paenibacillus faecalis]|uniref:papain-like cysteine protease family protein n=1 Tax=Paenibacillus faecalis TaxID=2079532 RepID=UPI000D0EA63E|nr:papain-like cysteine protease family protein [Paenibacillus faecalis]